MDTPTPPTDTPPTYSRKRRIFAKIKGLAFTLIVLGALWLAMRYVLTPLVLPQEPTATAVQVETPAAPVDAAMEERLKALEDKVATLESAKAESAQTIDIAPFESRITALEARPAAPVSTLSNEALEALQSDVEKLKKSDQAYVRSVILVNRLQERIREGLPFDAELNALSSLRPDLKEMTDALQPLSAAGVATLAQLQEQFRNAITPALAPVEKDKSFTQNLRSLVKIRKIGEDQTGNDDQAIIARAEAKLKGGWIAMAIAEIENLSPHAAQNFQAWVKRANDYLLADAAGQRLQSDIAKEIP